MSMFLPPFEGRLSRRQYWIGNLILIGFGLLAAGILIVAFIVSGGVLAEERSTGEKQLSMALVIAILIPWSALVVKRTKDLDFPLWTVAICLGAVVLDLLMDLAGVRYLSGLSGWFAAILFVLNVVWSVGVLGFVRGTAGPNRHGPDPLVPA
ncbi:DUF805 domain-containing protein [Phreatobacter sp.]|uniref:DUF805 domain-containing protein n=1 Tax=Phreatobacter sp. TaxID=1966341 RepID=UPI003F715600